MKKYTHYLFDWGDTLMVDFPSEDGAMCTWPKVEAVQGAEKLLGALSRVARCYIATNAEASHEHEIRAALARVELSRYLEGIFCFRSLGLRKPSHEFFNHILVSLKAEKNEIVMIGDDLEKDVYGALNFGIDAIWLNTKQAPIPDGVMTVTNLGQILQ